MSRGGSTQAPRCAMRRWRHPRPPRQVPRTHRRALRESGGVGLFADVVNVFVDSRGQYGNPLGIIWSPDSTRGQEQQIASDLGFSETIFIDEVADGRARARIFT